MYLTKLTKLTKLFLAAALTTTAIAQAKPVAPTTAAAPSSSISIPTDRFKELNYYILQAENAQLRAKQAHAEIDKQVADQMQQIQAQANPALEKLRKDLKVPADYLFDQTKQAFVAPQPQPAAQK